MTVAVFYFHTVSVVLLYKSAVLLFTSDADHAKGNIGGLGECLLTEKNQEHIVVGKSTSFC